MVRSVVGKRKSPKTLNEDLLPPIRKSILLEKWDDGSGKKFFVRWSTRNGAHRTEISLKAYEVLREVVREIL